MANELSHKVSILAVWRNNIRDGIFAYKAILTTLSLKARLIIARQRYTVVY